MSQKSRIAACELLLSQKRQLLNDANSIRTNIGSKRWLLTCNTNSNSYSMSTIQSQCQRGLLTSTLRPIHSAKFVNFQKYVCIEFYENTTPSHTQFSIFLKEKKKNEFTMKMFSSLSNGVQTSILL